MSRESAPANSEPQTTWLSGIVVTFLNKLVLPVLWFAFVAGVPLWVYITVGRISVRSDFQFVVWFALIASVPLTWFTVHLQLVGYCGKELVVGNYWREARIPFDLVDSVDSPWWYRRRMVRIRFCGDTPFGRTVYYLPKWGFARALMRRPEEELQAVIDEARMSAL